MKINNIKNTAKIKLTGNYIRCSSSSLLYFIIITLITFFQSKATIYIKNTVILAIIQAILLIINWIFSYGIIANILDLADVKTNSITDFINLTIKNGIKYIKIGLNVLLKIVGPLFLFILTLFYWIGTEIAKINKINFLCFNQNLTILSTVICILSGIFLIYFVLKYILIAYIFYENNDMSEKEIVNKSKELMTGNIFKYITLLLSFLHWFLIGALILFILSLFIKQQYLTPFTVLFYSIIRPYVITSKFEFYKELDDVKEEKAGRKG